MYKVSDISQMLLLNEVTATEEGKGREVKGVVSGDLLSWIMANGKEGDVWVTIQTHQNIVAVAVLLGFSSIIISQEATIGEDTISKALEENIPIYTTPMTSYELCGKLYALGIGN
jgi:hypothetical protein